MVKLNTVKARAGYKLYLAYFLILRGKKCHS